MSQNDDIKLDIMSNIKPDKKLDLMSNIKHDIKPDIMSNVHYNMLTFFTIDISISRQTIFFK